ncbi:MULTISPECIES: hypothetical protein [unclassified Streptomyces]|uniref:hypothetical protein n=1 Tax=unclassified Streptomyces TaxID=2593676 RepID=UPI002E7A0B9E|nr:hypothetical protein [Streptomyces sp. JV184]MEE1743367.1 hypothetical protein [Streptomyces sp. JV184]
MSTAESTPATEPRGGEEPDAGVELARRVFTGQERWGWEFVQLSAPPAHRDAQHPPVAIEPTQIQALPATGLVLVETGPAGRRVVSGDCNPGINFLPRLSARPRASLT